MILGNNNEKTTLHSEQQDDHTFDIYSSHLLLAQAVYGSLSHLCFTHLTHLFANELKEPMQTLWEFPTGDANKNPDVSAQY